MNTCAQSVQQMVEYLIFKAFRELNSIIEFDLVLIPGLGRSLGEGNGNLLQYSCLENPMDRGA